MGTFTESFYINIDGRTNEPDGAYEGFVFRNIVLRQELLRPNELRFTMQSKEVIDSMDTDDFPTPRELMGAKVECRIKTLRFKNNDETEDETELLTFKGIVFDVNVYSSSNMFSEQLIDVTAYSSDYLLMDHPHCFSYENMTLKEIVEKTIEPYQDEIKNPQIDPLHETNKNKEDKDKKWEQQIPYTVQYNETNYQFLTRLAQRYGQWMYHDGEKWIFGKIQRKKAIGLKARNDIRNYHFSTKILHHKVKQVHHNYLEYTNPQKSSSEVSDLETSGYNVLTDAVKQKAAALYKKETFHHVRCSNPEGAGKKPGNEINEIEVSLKTKLYGEKTQQVVCSGSTVRADLTIGSCIEILDDQKSKQENAVSSEYGDLIIIGITHYTEEIGEYRNSFTAVPSKADYPPYFQSDIFPVSSAQRAKVIDNVDPELMGRIRVQFLWQEVQDQNLMTPWIRIAQPHGGSLKGFYFIPEIDEEVMVDFENGNAEKPYVVGTLWHEKNPPIVKVVDGEMRELPIVKKMLENNELKQIRSRDGHAINFGDYKDQRGYMKLFDGKDDNYSITLDADRKTITIQAKSDIYLNARGNIVMNAGANMTLNVGGDYSLKATNVSIDAKDNITAVANAHATLIGQSGLTVNTPASGDVTAGGHMNVGGSSTTITGAVSMGGGGSAAVTIQGSSVSIQ